MPTRRPLHAITLDFWHTLYTDAPGTEPRRTELRLETIGRLLGARGEAFSDEALLAAHAAVGAEHVALHARGLDITHSAQVAHLLDLLHPGLAGALDASTLAAIQEAYATPGLAFPPAPTTSHLRAILADLRERGLRIGLISNTGRTPGTALRAIMDEAGVLAPFDHLTFSDEVELAKPNPAIFARTLTALGASADEAVHVGDDPTLDVFGARQAGLAAIQVGTPLPGATGATAGAAPADVAPDSKIATLDELPAALDRLAHA